MQRPEFVPCCAQVQLEPAKCTATRTMGAGPVAHAHDQHTQYADGPQVGHFQGKCENRGLAHVRRLLCNELATPDLLLLLAKCPGSRNSRSAGLTGRGNRVCESTGNRIFAFWRTPLSETRNRKSVQRSCIFGQQVQISFQKSRKHSHDIEKVFKTVVVLIRKFKYV